jgi:hypothetical protein
MVANGFKMVVVALMLSLGLQGCGGGSSSDGGEISPSTLTEVSGIIDDGTGNPAESTPEEVVADSADQLPVESIGEELTPEEAADEALQAADSSSQVEILATYSAPVLNPVQINGTSYNLSWTQLGSAPSGAYDLIIDGVDTNATNRTKALNAVVSGLTAGVQHCFQVQGRFLQARPDQFLVSNKVCVSPAPTTSAPVLNSVQVNGTSFILNWSQPGTDVPSGGYDLFIDSVDTNLTYRTSSLSAVVDGLTAGVQHCFEVQGRFLQTDPDQVPVSNKMCATSGTIGTPNPPQGPIPVIPGGEGFGVSTPAGRGGKILKVTNLNDNGPGSLRAALEASGPRIVVFEVSGTIALQSRIYIYNPYLTIAGQTAPSPGINIRNHGLYVRTHDVMIQHLRFRIGDTYSDLTDCINLFWYQHPNVIYNVVIDHCSLAWGRHNNIVINYGVKDITMSNSIIGEGFQYDSGISRGVLLTYNVTNISILNNFFISNMMRNPEMNLNASVIHANNLIYNGGKYSGWVAAVGGAVTAEYPNGQPSVIKFSSENNHFIDGPNTLSTIPIYYLHNSLSNGTQVYINGNIYNGSSQLIKNLASSTYLVGSRPVWNNNIQLMPASSVFSYVINNAGARPIDRDAVDVRLIREINARTGSWKSTVAAAGGYPMLVQNYRIFNSPTNPSGDDDGDGYTNIEEILHQMAALVEGK